jgi:hypothetical protein
MDCRCEIQGTKIAFVEANHQYIEIPVQELDANGEPVGAADLTGYSASFSYRIAGKLICKSCTIEGDTLLTSFEAKETLSLGGKRGSYEARVYKDDRPYTVVRGILEILASVDPRLEPFKEEEDG